MMLSIQLTECYRFYKCRARQALILSAQIMFQDIEWDFLWSTESNTSERFRRHSRTIQPHWQYHRRFLRLLFRCNDLDCMLTDSLERGCWLIGRRCAFYWPSISMGWIENEDRYWTVCGWPALTEIKSRLLKKWGKAMAIFHDIWNSSLDPWTVRWTEVLSGRVQMFNARRCLTNISLINVHRE